MPFGVDDLDWDQLIEAVIRVLVEVGCRETTIRYGDLARRLRNEPPGIELDPHYGAMPRLLETVNIEVRNRDVDAPMISALVVNSETGEPGGGFYQAAKDVGYVVGDRLMFWTEHVQRTYVWAKRLGC